MLKYVVDKKDEFINEMCEFINHKSLTCEEGDFAQYLVERFTAMGADEVFIDGAGNFTAILKGNGTGPNVMLDGHMDVVDPGELSAWEPYKPFEATVEDGKVIGRGISDLKGGLAAQLMAFDAFLQYKKAGNELPGDIIFMAVVQEEPAECFGMRYYFEKTMVERNIKVDCVLLCEPSSLDLAIGQRGKIELVVKTYGKCAHSSVPKEGINALELMVPILDDIFSGAGISYASDPKYGESGITVTNCICKPGGTLSCTPDYCEISIDRRYMPSQTIEDLLGDFEAIFKRLSTKFPEFKATVEPRRYEETSYTGYTEVVPKYHPAWETARDNEFVEASFKALRALGQDPAAKYWKFGTDGGITSAEYHIPTIGYSGAMEPQAHQPKEYVVIDDMMKCFEGYIAILAEIYGVDLEFFNK